MAGDGAAIGRRVEAGATPASIEVLTIPQLLERAGVDPTTRRSTC